MLKNHEQRRARAGKLGLDRYPASHTRLVQRILNEKAEIYAKPNGEITLVDAQNTKRAQTLNFLEGGPDFEEIIQNIRSRMKDKWAFHYIEVGKTQIDVDVKLMTVRNPRMIRFTATLDDLKTYATSIPHQAFLGEPADDRFSLDDVDFSQLAKLASIARTNLRIADGVVRRVSLSKPHRERGGNIEWQVQVRSAHAPLFMGPNTPPVAEGSVSFDMSGNVLRIKSPPGFASKTNLFDPTALQKAVDKIGERLGHHVLLTELMIRDDSIDITAQDPQNKSKLAVFAYKDEDVVRASEAKAAMANSFGVKSDWLWDLSMLRPDVVTNPSGK